MNNIYTITINGNTYYIFEDGSIMTDTFETITIEIM